MSLRINDKAPNFSAQTTQGEINFHEWLGDQWGVLFSHPKDFTPVCTTELGYMAGLESEFTRRNCKIIGLSVDAVDNHAEWAKDIEETRADLVDNAKVLTALLNSIKEDRLDERILMNVSRDIKSLTEHLSAYPEFENIINTRIK